MTTTHTPIGSGRELFTLPNGRFFDCRFERTSFKPQAQTQKPNEKAA